MSMGKTGLEYADEKLRVAGKRLRDVDGIEREAALDVIEAVAHVISYCRKREAMKNRREPAQSPATYRDEWWHSLVGEIQADCKKRGWSDVDASIAWMMGRDALLRARGFDARFPHDSTPPRTPS